MRARLTWLLMLFLTVSCASPRIGSTFKPLELDASPRSWAQLGLSGRLIFIKYTNQGNQLLELDLGSGRTSRIYQAPQQTWLPEAAVSPDGTQVVFAYTPPPEESNIAYGFTDLYIMPLDRSSPPRPLSNRQDLEESFFHPAWSPDGNSIYYSYFYNAEPGSQVPAYRFSISKTSLAGEVTPIVQDAYWPGISPDGEKLAYLSAYADTSDNELYIANVDGTDSRPVLPMGSSQAVDAHIFTMDGRSLIFSMVNDPETQSSSLLARLVGVTTAFAHDVPSDWFIAPIEGGEPERLTRLFETALHGDLSPDGRYLAFIGRTGLYVMDLESRQVSLVVRDVFVGTIDWLP